MNKTEFNKCLEMIRSSNPEEYENGYWRIQDSINEYLDELICLIQNESNPDMRSRFIELVGDSMNKKVIPILEIELKSENRLIRSWAWQYLFLHLELEEARNIAIQYKVENPNEDFYFDESYLKQIKENDEKYGPK